MRHWYLQSGNKLISNHFKIITGQCKLPFINNFSDPTRVKWDEIYRQMKKA